MVSGLEHSTTAPFHNILLYCLSLYVQFGPTLNHIQHLPVAFIGVLLPIYMRVKPSVSHPLPSVPSKKPCTTVKKTLLDTIFIKLILFTVKSVVSLRPPLSLNTKQIKKTPPIKPAVLCFVMLL